MKAYLFILNTLSDWEIGYLLAELNSGRFFKQPKKPVEIIKVGNNPKPIHTMGSIDCLSVEYWEEYLAGLTDSDVAEALSGIAQKRYQFDANAAQSKGDTEVIIYNCMVSGLSGK